MLSQAAFKGSKQIMSELCSSVAGRSALINTWTLLRHSRQVGDLLDYREGQMITVRQAASRFVSVRRSICSFIAKAFMLQSCRCIDLKAAGRLRECQSSPGQKPEAASHLTQTPLGA